MDPALFLNRVFQMAALNNYAQMLDKEYGEQGGCFCDFDGTDECTKAFKTAQAAGESPQYICSEEHGHFVTHTFGKDDEAVDLDEDPGMRMVCYAEIGPQAFNTTACEWWKAQGADPDKYAPGITTLHEPEPEPEDGVEPDPEPEPPSREATIDMIKGMGELNPTGDPHGSIDPQFTKACREFDPDYQTETPLTLEEWRELTRGEDSGYDKPFARDIKDAVDPFVFLAVLRDRMVFASGCTDQMIRIIGIFVNQRIDSHTMTWRT
ncbi:hypothetical protein N9917_00070 [Deltaproteobacteria bacterium]|nr:hypothetical protein [Deltaproteobacteria bacterium]